MRPIALLACACLAASAAQAASIVVPAGAKIVLPANASVLGACLDLSVAGQVSSAAPLYEIGNLTISSGGTFELDGAYAAVGGNWSNSGTFNHHGNSTVSLGDTCSTGAATVSAGTSFFNLTLASSVGKTFTIPSGAQTFVAGALVFNGSAINPLQVVSSNPGQPADIILGPGATVSGTGYQLGAKVGIGATTLTAGPDPIAFGGQSMGTTSPATTITLANTGSATLTVGGISTDNAQFAQSNNCTSVAPGANCSVNVTFLPAVAAGALNAAAPASGVLTITSNAAGSPHVVALSGVGQKSLVTHYYRSILRRAPDAGGASFWSAEAQRLKDIGANVNEAWFAMAQFFYFSAEYAALNRDDTGYVTDLYTTFFNRAPDAGGLNFWVSNLQQGMPREVLLAAFMFSPEFGTFTQAIFGNTAARAEVDVVMDFYRGMLARTPDGAGFDSWVAQFRAAQCQGGAAVNATVEAISSAFATGGEYLGRNRTNAQYVGDLYNSFLRRGGDLGGVQFWINEINTSARSREVVRQNFIASPEFQGRVNNVVNQGCLP